MIPISDAEQIHRALISNFGGIQGVRDMSLLESALARPFQTFDNTELYPGLLEKAASLVESILINHPFMDGNKRTGYVLMRLLLVSNGLDITADSEERYKMIIGVASGKTTFGDILEWLRENTAPRP